MWWWRRISLFAVVILAAQSVQAQDRPTCEIVTAPSLLRESETLAFLAVARSADGTPLPDPSITWRSDQSGIVSIDERGVATGGNITGVANITCEITGSGLLSPPVAIRNYANVESGIARVVVVDERTTSPILGATVLFEPAGLLVTTDSNGIAQIATTDRNSVSQIAAERTVNVHVFTTGYSWMSIIGTTAMDLLVPLAATPDKTKAGGFKGEFDFSLLPNPLDTVQLGLAGASLAGSFIDLDFTKLLGELVRRRVQIGPVGQDILLPSGLVLKVGDLAIQGEYRVLADAGLRHAWAIGGGISLEKLVQILAPLLGGGGEKIPFGQIIFQILSLFGNLHHFVKTDVNITEVPKVADINDINGNGSTTDLVPDFQNPVAFPVVTAQVNQPLTLSTSMTLPALPLIGGRPLDGVFILAGANAANRGFVPLGFSAAVDAPRTGEIPDGQVDVDPSIPGNQNTLHFNLSPLHDGLEGSPFVFATLATSLQSGSSLPPSVSGILTQTDHVEDVTSLGVSNFLGFPETALFDPSTRAFNLGRAVSDAAFYRADFRGADSNWVVYFKEPSVAGAPAFVLPAPPAGTDRAMLDCNRDEAGTQPCRPLRVVALGTKPCLGAAAPGLDAISAFGTINLTKLNDCLGAFSSEECLESGDCARFPRHSLRLLKTVADLNGNGLLPGDELRYTLQLTNDGLSDATGVTVVDALPPAVQLTAAGAGCISVGAEIICNVGTLAAGANTRFEFTARLNNVLAPGTIVSNQAFTTSRELNNPVPSDNPATPAANDATTVVVSFPPPPPPPPSPPPPSTPDLLSTSDTGISDSDDITRVSQPTFVGTAQPGLAVFLFVDGISAGVGMVDGMGSWMVTAPSSLPDGVHVITAVAIDGPGTSPSAPSAPLMITIDTMPPAITCPVPLTIVVGPTDQAIVPNFRSELTTPREPLIITQDPASGTLLDAGAHVVMTPVSDVAGNSSTCATRLTVLNSPLPMVVQPSVVQRARLGNITRDIAFVPTGSFAHHIAILDGYEVLGVAAAGRGSSAVHKLFDVRGLPIERSPEGLAYIEPDRRFAFIEASRPTILVLSDHRGQPQGTRTIQYISGAPDFVDGMTYIPATSPVFPAHLVVAFQRGEVAAGLAVIRRDGLVVAEIIPPPLGTDLDFVPLIFDVAYGAPDRLLVTTSLNEIWTLDFDGNVLAGPVNLREPIIEALEQLPDGTAVVASRETGDLLFLDQNLTRLREEDRRYFVGVGMSLLSGVDWNSNDHEHLVSHFESEPADLSLRTVVAAVPPSLDSARRVVVETGPFLPQTMTYLPDEHLISLSLGSGSSPPVRLYDLGGHFVEGLVIPAFEPIPGVRGRRRLGATSYVPIAREFAVVTRQEPRKVHFVARNGTLMRTIDFSSVGLDRISALAYFNPDHPSGGQLLMVDSAVTDRVLIANLDGRLVGEFNFRQSLNVLSVRDAAGVTTGPQAGALSLIDSGNSEIVVFTLHESTGTHP